MRASRRISASAVFVLVEIAHDHDQAAAPQQPAGASQGRGHGARARRGQARKRREIEVQVMTAAARRHVLHARRLVAASPRAARPHRPDRSPGSPARGRGRGARSNFDPRSVGKRHRAADIDDKQRARFVVSRNWREYRRSVRRKRLPVDVLQIVAGPIVAVLAELGVEAVKRAAMQPLPQALDRRARQQLEIAQRRQFGGRDDVGTVASEASRN